MRNLRLPSFPVTGFRHAYSNNTYSGGTVRDLHPIILFSRIGSSPILPQRGYSIVKNIVAQVDIAVNQTERKKPPSKGWLLYVGVIIPLRR